ncbi:unnamed protein product [Miscanthus lutarioriparius]|uniref:tRNA 4-demethylwyosine synthase (AdoMet-dependent) n=1 Tax=Miscanthus lutarioriparius TaxID=422564 RepID=A0A811MTH1_9POAL|nr:unnamed protein product [Miscanthus lutarioriparius]
MTVARGPPGRPSSGLLGCWRRRPALGFGAKVGIAIALGLSFAIIWTSVSPTSSSQQISTERSSFAAEVAAPPTASHNRTAGGGGGHAHRKPRPVPHSHKKRHPVPSGSHSHPHRSNATASPDAAAAKADHSEPAPVTDPEPKEKQPEQEQEQEPDMEMEPEQEAELPVPEQGGDNSGKAPAEEEEEKPPQLELEDEPSEGDGEEDDPEAAKRKAPSKKRKLPPLFSPGAHYHWKLCGAKSGYHYIPCVDFDGDGSQRHHERSCPRSPVTCLVSLPKEYKQPAPWPERKGKVWYGNVGHPRLSNYVKGHNWLNHSGEYLTFPPDEWEFKGSARHYVESIDEMAPDIDWGKNIRIILDVGCKSAGFGIALLEKDVITLSLGLMNDQTDLAQVALERGIPATVGSLGSQRLPFPSGAFDAIHCGECNIPWHSNGGKLLLEINRILRPGGYFIISSKSADLESEEGISASMTALCWNAIAYNSDDVSEAGVKIFQRPASNEVYDLRAKKDPPFCKEEQNKASAWYTHIKHCLHKAPVGIEERGSDWPEEWPKRLESFPEWLGGTQTRVASDHNHWKAVVEKSYLDGLGIDWSNIRNVMDMRAVFGGFAAALASKKVWVMNVVPVHAADTLPIIYERGLIGVYHDWCEPFSTYPRSYDLLHADHLFSRLKIRCKQPVSIVVEMDRILRPGGWAIIRDKLEILDPLETILKSLHWEIVMTFRKDKEGIIRAWKRPSPPRPKSKLPSSKTQRPERVRPRTHHRRDVSLPGGDHRLHHLPPRPPRAPLLFLPLLPLQIPPPPPQTLPGRRPHCYSYPSLRSRLTADAGFPVRATDAATFDPDDLPSVPLLLLVIPTHEGGGPPPSAAFLSRWLEESAADFRAGALLLSGLLFAVFGVGSQVYGETFNAASRSFSRWLRALGAVEVVPLGEGDMDGGDLEAVFEEWSRRVLRVVKGEEVGYGANEKSNGLDELELEGEDWDDDDEEEMVDGEVDMEDIAGKAPARRKNGNLEGVPANGVQNGVKDMVTPIIRTSLEKQGYKIIGSHSGVKICRWIKSQLRGRGGCYKHSFYGIESHRHHTNPVGKSWKWKMDDPLDIVNAAIDQHTKMVKQMKGLPGVKPEKLEEGLSPRHCVLSLVGEPIMCPEINALVDELHRRHISTFLVTNAQFPEKIKALKPITQLYVSVDAATKESLKAVDRPLFSDFWERFLDSLKSLHEKDQRTVYRLTLVKGWNAEERDAYAKLLDLGQPDFIEIKGVTYCGSSATSKLTMENVPWHSDVKEFSEVLASKSGGVYEVDKFKINGKWHTWIDYDRFHELVTPGKPFKSRDYMAMTPSWAVYGAEEGGFDPDQSRFKKERRHGTAAHKSLSS